MARPSKLRPTIRCPCFAFRYQSVLLGVVAALTTVLFTQCVDIATAVSSPDGSVLQRIPIVSHQSELERNPELADLYQAAPISTMVHSIRKSSKEVRFETLVSLSMPEGNATTYVELKAWNVGAASDGQAWYTLDILDFSVLKAPCNNPAYFLPAMAVTPDQRQLVLFGFGPLPQCHNVFIWKFGFGLSEVLAGNGERVAHALHTIAVGETMEERAHDHVPRKYLHVFSYGGMKCECFFEVHGSDFISCIRQCTSVSDSLWQLKIPKYGRLVGDWVEVLMSTSSASRFSPPAPPAPLLHPSLHIRKSLPLLVMLVGGLEARYISQRNSSDLKANTKVWLGFVDDKRWQLGTDLVSWHLNPGKVEGRNLIIFIPQSVYVAKLDSLVLATYGRLYLEGLSFCRFSLSGSLKRPSVCSLYTTINKFLPGSRPRGFYMTSSVSSDILLQFAQSSTVLRALQPDLMPGEESLLSHKIVITELNNYVSYSSQFPGSRSCYCPAPVPVMSTTQVEQSLLFIGGSCNPMLSMAAESGYLASYVDLAVWTVRLKGTQVVYTRRFSNNGDGTGVKAGCTVTPLDEKTYIVFGGISLPDFHSNNMIHGLQASKTAFSWLFHRRAIGLINPRSRAFHIAFRHDSNSVIIHGGFHHDGSTRKEILCDIWIFYTRQQREGFSSLNTWENLTSRVRGRTLPCVFGHTYTVHQGVGLIYGGTRTLDARPSPSGLSAEQLTDPDNSLIYTIVVSPDAKTVTTGSISIEPPIPQRAFHSLSTYTTNSLLLLGGVNEPAGNSSKQISLPHLFFSQNNAATVAVLIKLNLTIPADMKADAVQFFPHLPMTSAHIVNRSFIFSGQSSDLPGGEHTIAKLDPDQHCPLGYGRSNSSPDCERCPKEHYSDSYDTQCKPCKQYRATNTTGSTDCYLVSPCKTDVCHGHGVCKEEPKVYQAICICDFGYLVYDNCQVPFVSLAIIAGVVLFVCLLTYALIKNQQRKSKIRKQGEKLHVQQVELDWKKKKLDELFDAVHVHWKYLFLIKRLYPDPQLQLPAGSTINEVWEAELGDMPVAVKVLKSQHSPDSSLKKFVHEAEMLRVVNHPNIVNFLGAGTQRNTQRPFLIMELVRGGSLYQLLQNTDIDIDHKCRLSFAIDGAKGMEYLHGCNPSKIHRDLKSANLLVTSRGHVKVADFGTTRFIEILDNGYSNDDDLLDGPQRLSLASRLLSGLRRHFQTGTKANNNAIPLLTTPVNHPVDIATGNSDEPRLPPMTYGVGTDRWKAPETLKQNYFDERTDVYSYGVVLWELYTRHLPYQEFHDDQQEEIRSEIKLGNRPFLPADMPYEYRHLVESCLRQEAKFRPSFKTIVRELQVQHRRLNAKHQE